MVAHPYPLKKIDPSTPIAEVVAAFAYNYRIQAVSAEICAYRIPAGEDRLKVLVIHPGIINGDDLVDDISGWIMLADLLGVAEVWVSGIHESSGLRSRLTKEVLQPAFGDIPVRAVGLDGHAHTGQQGAWMAAKSRAALFDRGLGHIVAYNLCGGTHLGRNMATMWRHLEHLGIQEQVLLLPLADKRNPFRPVRLTKDGENWGNFEWEYNLLQGEVARHLEMGCETLIKPDGKPSDVVTVAQAMAYLDQLPECLRLLGVDND